MWNFVVAISRLSSIETADISQMSVIYWYISVKDLRHGQWRVHIQWRALPGVEDDGGEQPEGHPAAADSGQDHLHVWQGGLWNRGVIFVVLFS